MQEVFAALELLREQHDSHQVAAYSQLMESSDIDDVAVMWSYSAGLMHAIRTIEDAIKAGR